MSFTPLRIAGVHRSRRLVNPRRFFTACYIVFLVAAVGAAALWFVDAHAHYKQLKLIEAENEQMLANAKKRLAEQQRILERLRTDPAFVEKVMRQHFHARPGEVIFRFED
jgi:cell division protein FtsB